MVDFYQVSSGQIMRFTGVFFNPLILLDCILAPCTGQVGCVYSLLNLGTVLDATHSYSHDTVYTQQCCENLWNARLQLWSGSWIFYRMCTNMRLRLVSRTVQTALAAMRRRWGRWGAAAAAARAASPTKWPPPPPSSQSRATWSASANGLSRSTAWRSSRRCVCASVKSDGNMSVWHFALYLHVRCLDCKMAGVKLLL